MVCAKIDHLDFAVVIKNLAPPPKSWRWEIYRAGTISPPIHVRIPLAPVPERHGHWAD
jgi:hypothetical protein